MITSIGEHYLQLNEHDPRLRRLKLLLQKVEAWVKHRDPRTVGANYWGVCGYSPEENCYVNLEDGYCGTPLRFDFWEVIEAFPELGELMDELELQPYIGKNYIGNWGIHRHAYNPTSRWNLLMLGKGNSNGRGEFYEANDGWYGKLSYDHVVDYLVEGSPARKVEEISLKPGQVYSIDTWCWHSHRVRKKEAHAWLLHFKYADSQDAVRDVLRMIPEDGWRKRLWRLWKRIRYWRGTDQY